MKMIELQTAYLRFAAFVVLFVTFSKINIDRKKKLAVRKIGKRIFYHHLNTHHHWLPETSSSDKHHKDPMFLYLWLCIYVIYQFIYT